MQQTDKPVCFSSLMDARMEMIASMHTHVLMHLLLLHALPHKTLMSLFVIRGNGAVPLSGQRKDLTMRRPDAETLQHGVGS